ncbi:hypothetical protein CRM22_006715, partial [Opisthorchis felineus]
VSGFLPTNIDSTAIDNDSDGEDIFAEMLANRASIAFSNITIHSPGAAGYGSKGVRNTSSIELP